MKSLCTIPESPPIHPSDIGTLPDAPGVYLYLDGDGVIIYVGKAISLRKRVRSYFVDPARLDQKTRLLLRHVAAIRIMVVNNELEALVLENKLIKKHQPRYNIRLKDDKTYPFLVLTTSERFPRLLKVRAKRRKKGDLYFGPMMSARSVDRLIRLAGRVFGVCTCQRAHWAGKPGKSRGCLNFQMNRCLGPCMAEVDPVAYAAAVKGVTSFLGDGGRALEAEFLARMKECSENEDFERAAWYRDVIHDMRALRETQTVDTGISERFDAIGIAGNEEVRIFVVAQYSGGSLADTLKFSFRETETLIPGGEAGVLGAFLKSYYGSGVTPPGEILLPMDPEDGDLIARWLSSLSGRQIALKVPSRGVRLRLVRLARLNAMEALNRKSLQIASEQKKSGLSDVLRALKESLGLPRTPRRIVCFDVSNLGTSEAVVGMTCFLDGEKHKPGYRKYAIRCVEGQDDFAMIREGVGRFLHHVKEDGWERPDLVLVDGGPGQLSAALQAAAMEGAGEMSFASIAKRHEEIYLPGRRDPIDAAADSPQVILLRAIRDETHRFAISFHRSRRSRGATGSVLDGVPGIGPKRKKALFRAFGSLENMAAAGIDGLMNAGIPEAAARNLVLALDRRVPAEPRDPAPGDGVSDPVRKR